MTFGTKNSSTDMNLVLVDKNLMPPAPKIQTVDIPGADGVLDLTQALGDDIKYSNRKLIFTFALKEPAKYWYERLVQISNYLHGKHMQITLDWDKDYYYQGRVIVKEFKHNTGIATLTIECDCDPYKYEYNSAGAPWIWDRFNFISGVIYSNKITVDGVREINLVNKRKIVSPVFTCTAPMTVEFKGATYQLQTGRNKILDIRLVEGNNTLTLKGRGEVGIEYRSGSL